MLSELWKLSLKWESLLHQKSQSKWISQGDANTIFFHLVVNGRRKRNNLRGLNIEGNWGEDPQKVKEEVKNYFENRFIEYGFERPTLDGVSFRELQNGDNDMLLEEFEEE